MHCDRSRNTCGKSPRGAVVRGDGGVLSGWLAAAAPPMANAAASSRRLKILPSRCFIVFPPVSQKSVAKSAAEREAAEFVNTQRPVLMVNQRFTNTGYWCCSRSVSRNSLKFVTGLSRQMTSAKFDFHLKASAEWRPRLNDPVDRGGISS